MLLVAAYWRTNLTLRQLAPLFGVSKPSADRIVGHLGPLLALRPRKRFRKDTVVIMDGTLVPTPPSVRVCCPRRVRFQLFSWPSLPFVAARPCSSSFRIALRT